MNPSIAKFEGPRLVRREEAIASEKLFHLCFDGPEIENEEEILSSFVPPRRGGVYALFDHGRPVSQIGIAHDRIRMYDGTIDTGSIGGVCTHPDFRNQGLASHLLEYCAQQMVKEGATLMLISGARGVYTRAGNVFHGKFVYFSIEKDTQVNLPQTGLELRKATATDALDCSRLYQAEPVHFIRRKADFLNALQNPGGNNYLYADPWVIERAGQVVAYIYLGIPYYADDSSGIRQVSEYAGSRSALAEAIPQIIRADHLQEVHWPVAWQDDELGRLLQEKAYEGHLAPLDGHTLRILNFPRFMKDLRPLLDARLDAKILRGLHVEQSGPLLGGTGMDRFAIVRGSDCLELDGAAMTSLILGNADVTAKPIHAPGALAEVVSALFPLPSFLPGLNYH